MRQAPDFSIQTLSELMGTEDIFSAWDDIAMAISILEEACENRLKELGYYDYSDDDDENLSEEVESLLELRDTLDNIDV